MAAGNGFITYSPDTRYGDEYITASANTVWAYKFTAPETGTLTITEIGAYLDGGATSVVHFAIFTDDSGNTCPDVIVSNSDSGEVSSDSSGFTKINYTYGTQPTVTGGTDYWLVLIAGTATTLIDKITGGGTGVFKSGVSYPTFPTGDAWHAHTDSTSSISFYAVYDAGGSASESPSASPSGISSESPSESPSPSVSESPSPSVSASPSGSPSMSPSPSPGWQGYTKGNYAELPLDDTDLESLYDENDYVSVLTDNDIRVGQDAAAEYAIHQFRDYVGTETQCTVTWQGQSTRAPSASVVTLQIYNYDGATWETIDTDNTTAANTDFTLTYQVEDLTNYKGTDSIMTCRVYQQMA